MSQPISPSFDCGTVVLRVQAGPSPVKAASPSGRLLTLTQLDLPAPSSRLGAGDWSTAYPRLACSLRQHGTLCMSSYGPSLCLLSLHAVPTVGDAAAAPSHRTFPAAGAPAADRSSSSSGSGGGSNAGGAHAGGGGGRVYIAALDAWDGLTVEYTPPWPLHLLLTPQVGSQLSVKSRCKLVIC